MTDKEQIIYTEETCPYCDSLVELPPFKGIYECPECKELIVCCSMCEEQSCNNCKYTLLTQVKEQLARKTQECESLKEEIEVLKDNFDTATRDCNDLIEELRQECEIWKNQTLVLNEEDVTVQVTQEQFEEYQKLKQECEELKTAYKKAQDIIGRLDKANKLKSRSIQKSTKECDRYRKALEEIEEAIKKISNYLNIGCDMDKCEDCNHFKPFCTNQCVCFLIGQGDLILDIINKAKGEGNENKV